MIIEAFNYISNSKKIIDNHCMLSEPEPEVTTTDGECLISIFISDYNLFCDLSLTSYIFSD